LTATQTAKHSQTILCIEDEQPLLRVRIALLESVGYRVLGAQTANAAMALFVENEIDLVLSDHMLRGVSGAELSIFMKQVRPGVAIVLLSGSHLPANIRQQVDACIEKGGPTQEFLDCLQDVLTKQATAKVRLAAQRCDA
jgi:CheY-like chemotaxis protein